VVERLDPTSAGSIWRSPSPAGSADRPSAWMRSMFSMTTMASSATRPIAAASPASVIRLIVWPVAPSARATIATVTGMVSPAMSVRRSLRRNAHSTRPASTIPISTASRVPRTESATNRAWS
jgi:hypothetical protein